ncbi:MAG: CocE/NonD family hydrolase [Bryobacter sp.]|nr:CocE/NonD family hydrolase [Bryobacter sp.]
MQDTRGRYESEGKWDPFRAEAQDGYDTVEWAAKQPWSNGKVALQGGSYLGHVQWAAAKLAPPSLVAMFPAVASTNLYANWITHGGAFRLSFNFGWGAIRMPNRIMLPQFRHTEAYVPPEWRYDTLLSHLPLKTMDVAAQNYAVKHWRDWLEHESYDAYWKTISDEEGFDKITVPAHTSGGWYDIFLAGTINGYTGMRTRGGSEKARAQARMLIGPWGHGQSQKFGDVDFGPDAMQQLFEYELRFFDYHVRGIQNGLDKEPPVKIFYMGANKWKGERDWPIPGTNYKPMYIDGGGKLSWNQPSGAVSDTYLYDPLHPVPTLGGNNCCGTPTLAGPKDQRPLELRPDVLVYTSEYLKEPVAIAGPVKFKLHAATDGPDTDWMVRLIDVHPNGFSMNVAEGALRARFHQGLDKVSLLTPNRTYEFTIDMVGTAVVFQPGHRIRIDITSSNFPQFDRNPNTGEPLGQSAKVRTAKNTVFHAPGRASHIVLPVVPLP